MPRLLQISLCLLLLSCGFTSTVDVNSQENKTPRGGVTDPFFPPAKDLWPRSAHTDLTNLVSGNPIEYTEAQKDEAAKVGMITFATRSLFGGPPYDRGKGVLLDLKRRNPDIIVIAHTSMAHTYPFAEIGTASWPWRDERDLLFLEESEMCLSTKGNPLFIWDSDTDHRDAYLTSPFDSNGKLNVTLIEKDIALFRKYYDQIHEGVDIKLIDGIFLDYFRDKQWLGFQPEDDREVDCDQDGIPMIGSDGKPLDLDEFEAFHQFQKKYIELLRRDFGDRLIIIGNGPWPNQDRPLRDLLDGHNNEKFGALYDSTPLVALERILATEKKDWTVLDTKKGPMPFGNGGYEWQDYCLGASLLANTWHGFDGQSFRTEERKVLYYGEPRSDVERKTEGTNKVFSRTYSRGFVQMTFDASGNLVDLILDER